MKTLAVLFALILGSYVEAQTQGSGKIIATVPNVNGTEGKVSFALYTVDTFMKQAPVSAAASEIKDGQATVTFENIAEGTYSIVVLHDRNNNSKMDFDSSGMPKEDYGTSGNTMSFGPPNWEESKFEFEGSYQEIEIRL